MTLPNQIYLSDRTRSTTTSLELGEKPHGPNNFVNSLRMLIRFDLDVWPRRMLTRDMFAIANLVVFLVPFRRLFCLTEEYPRGCPREFLQIWLTGHSADGSAGTRSGLHACSTRCPTDITGGGSQDQCLLSSDVVVIRCGFSRSSRPMLMYSVNKLY